MAISQLPQAPHRQDRKVFPTPLIGDVLFSEIRDCTRILIPEYGTPHPDTEKWPHHKLVYVKPVDIDRNEIFEFYYAADRENQDLYNFEFTDADIGPTKFKAVKRTYVIRRDDFQPSSILMGAAMPTDPDGKFTDTYVLAQREEIDAPEEVIRSIFVVEQHTYVKKVAIYTNEFDEPLSGMLQIYQELFYKGEVVEDEETIEEIMEDPQHRFWGLQKNGAVREGKQLTDNWWVVSTRAIVPEPFATEGRTYNTTINYSWPPVLSNIYVENWSRRDGGSERYFIPSYSKEGYNGPCAATVTETFHITPPELDKPNVMMPLPIDIQTPYFGIRVGATLHNAYNLTFTNGTTDPDFVYTAANYYFSATEPVEWPAEILAQDTVEPFRGGYLRTRIVVFPPDYTEPEP